MRSYASPVLDICKGVNIIFKNDEETANKAEDLKKAMSYY